VLNIFIMLCVIYSMVMYGDLEGMGKKVVIGYLKVLDIHQESLRTI
jgi:hypothetical protein